MQMLFLGGPLDGQWLDVDLPLTETVGLLEDRELVTVESYDPPVRPYFLHTVLAEDGIVPMYSTTPDWDEFGAQLSRVAIDPVPKPDPADLPGPATLTLWIPGRGGDAE